MTITAVENVSERKRCNRATNFNVGYWPFNTLINWIRYWWFWDHHNFGTNDSRWRHWFEFVYRLFILRCLAQHIHTLINGLPTYWSIFRSPTNSQRLPQPMFVDWNNATIDSFVTILSLSLSHFIQSPFQWLMANSKCIPSNTPTHTLPHCALALSNGEHMWHRLETSQYIRTRWPKGQHTHTHICARAYAPE